MNSKQWIGIGATVVVVTVSGAVARFAVDKQKPEPQKTEQKSEVLKTDDGNLSSEELELIKAKPTDTPKPTQEVTKTPKPTDTPKPTPSIYKKNPEATTTKANMENEICAVFGEQDCQGAIAIARIKNMNLNPTNKWDVNGYGVGLFGLYCGYPRVLDAYGVATLDECKKLAIDYKTNILAAKKLYDAEGWVSLRKACGGL